MPGEVQAGSPRDSRQEQALGDQHSHQTNSRGAERKPQCDFAPAGRGARQQQRGNVSAGNEQYEVEGSKKESDQHEIPAGRSQFEFLGPGTIGCSDPGSTPGVQAILLLRQYVHFRLRL